MKSLTANQVKVGFIGLGNMGSRIAQRLLEHGYQVCVYDVDPIKAEPLVAQGGTVTSSAEEDFSAVVRRMEEISVIAAISATHPEVVTG